MIKGVTLDGVAVTRPVAAFSIPDGYVDVFVIGSDGKPPIVNGRPVTERLHGRVEAQMDPAMMAQMVNLSGA